ncbi:unnamed protein product [Mytilus coruscus]|uniref:Uncharacterized protein n=1 Tax=Mytilus coruscus TaxID=42192 RepID=A0A6J8B9H1_MYTCO|nr:unnamed protein product [Mytilus coruscus]
MKILDWNTDKRTLNEQGENTEVIETSDEIEKNETFANNALQNQQDGVFVGEDKRGKHAPYNKTTNTAMDLVRRNIESFPVVDGHYTRKDSNRKYLGADLNIKRMYELYIVQCKDQIPEKDIASQARNIEGTLTNDIKKAYDKHQARKIKAREEKKKDKELAKSSPEFFVGTFDLQAVLQTPCSLVSQMCYNLSIYNLANNKATFDLWSEVDAQRGSCEIEKEYVNGKEIKWLKIRWLRYTKENPDCILFKYKMDDEFREMKVALTSTRGRATEEYQLIKKYTSRQSISAAKKKDIVGLCKKGIIPSEYHEYYKSLLANINVKDTLAETDVEEEKNDSYQD